MATIIDSSHKRITSCACWCSSPGASQSDDGGETENGARKRHKKSVKQVSDDDDKDGPRAEEPLFIESCLKSLENEIAKMSGAKRIAYDIAKKKDSQYVGNKDFRMMFLRADEYVPQKAAKRIMKHFEVKLELFGENKLVQDIMYDDLSSDDHETLRAGSHQYLGNKDAKGSGVCFVFAGVIKASSVESLMRAQWYIYMEALQDEITQKRGVVGVAVGHHVEKYKEWGPKAQSTMKIALPIKVAMIHLCLINNEERPLALDMIAKLTTRWASNFRYHVEDSPMTCLYTLQSFGINPAIVPLEYDGRPATKLHLEVLEKRRKLERIERNGKECSIYKKEENDMELSKCCTGDGSMISPPTTPTTTTVDNTQKSNAASSSPTSSATSSDPVVVDGIIPTNRDVLLGQGLKHAGNFALDKLIDTELASHQKAPTQFEKTCIVLATVRRIEAAGGRFLKRSKHANQEWEIADDAAARNTVSTRFKNRARKSTGGSTATSLTNSPTTKTISTTLQCPSGTTTTSAMATDNIYATTEKPQPMLQDHHLQMHRLQQQMQYRMRLLQESQQLCQQRRFF